MAEPIGISVSLDIQNLQSRMGQLAFHLRPDALAKLIGQAQLFWINENFRQQGALFGGWQSLRPNTIADPKRGGSGAQPLRSSGSLARSFVVGAQGNIFRTTADTVTVGTQNQTAAYHHFGTKGPYPIPKYTLRFRTDKRGRRYVVPLAFYTVRGLIFRRSVQHPGLPVRRLLPDELQARELTMKHVNAYVEKVLRENARS